VKKLQPRYILIISLILISAVFLFMLIPLSQVDGTFFNTQFYKDRVREVDPYQGVYDTLLPTLLDVHASGYLLGTPINVESIQGEIVSVTKETLTPGWLQEQTESGIDVVVPYFTDNLDSFTYNIPLSDRVYTAAEAIKEDIVASDNFTVVYNAAISFVANATYHKLSETKWDPGLSQPAIEAILYIAISDEWFRYKIAESIDEITPYLTGDSEHFAITVTVEELVLQAVANILDLITSPDTYKYLLEELLKPAIEDSLGDTVDLPFGVSLTVEELVSTIEEVISDSWTEEQLENIRSTITDYLMGESDDTSVTIDLEAWINDALDTLEVLVDEELRALFDSLPEYSMEEFLQELESLPPNTLPDGRPSGESYEDVIGMLDIDVESLIQELIIDKIPDEWTLPDITQSFGDVIDDFLVGINLEEMIKPALEDALGDSVDLPFGVTLTLEEIISAIEEIISDSWIQEQLEDIVSTITTYLTGETDRTEVTIDLEAWIEDSLDTLVALADEKLQELFNNLPEYSMEEFLQDIEGLPPDTLPDKRPADLSYEDAIDMLDIDIEGLIRELLIEEMPEDWTFDDVTQLFSDAIDDFLDGIREVVSLEWTYTDADLKEELGSDRAQKLENVRSLLHNGFTFTSTDLREAIGDEEALEAMDDGRYVVSTVRNWLWALTLIPLVLLFIAFLIYGRPSRKRLFIYLAGLFLVVLLFFLMGEAVMSKVVSPIVEETITEPLQYQIDQSPLGEEGDEIAIGISNDSFSGPRGVTFFLLLLTGLGALALILWRVRRRMRE